MPGGHRPFREDPTSYNKTGIPCGNPMRYESRGVIRMGKSDRPYKDQRLEAPVEDIETEGERQLKLLVQRQLEKDVTVGGKLMRTKQFQTSSLHKPITAEVSGPLTLEAFRGIEGHDRRLEELQQYGLTPDEIQLTLEADGVGLDGQPAKKSRYGVDPRVHTAKLEAIQRKIAKKREDLAKPEHFSSTRYMSRHEMDLERAISHTRDKYRLLGMLMTNNNPSLESRDPNDPINQLDSIMEEVRQKASKSREKRWESASESSDEGSESSGVASCGMKPEGYRSRNNIPQGELCPLCRVSIPNMPQEQQWNTKDEKICCNCNQTFRESNGVASNKQEPVKSRKVKKDIELSGNAQNMVEDQIESIPEDVIMKYKLTTDEIRQLPRFSDYEPGTPSKTLYLKNLTGKVTQADLVSLFRGFHQPDEPEILYKLMTGRMRGQAFVTFKDAETAARALDLVNGYDFRGKPIIIQYGKK